MVGALTAAAFPAIVIGAGLGALSVGWYRWLYRSTLGKAARELERALNAVEGSLRSQEVFGAAPPARRRVEPPADDVTTLLLGGIGDAGSD